MRPRDELKAFWTDLQAARGEILAEVEGLSQPQFDWRPQEGEWSIGEVIHHLTLAEAATGKMQTRILREAEAAGSVRPYVPGAAVLDPLPPVLPGRATGAPAHIWPRHGLPIKELVGGIKAARERTRYNFERFAEIDPRALVWDHVFFGPIHLGQYWTMMLRHDQIHIPQLRAVKAAPGFPPR